MARRDRLVVLIVLLLVSTFVFAGVASAQEEPPVGEDAIYRFSFGLEDVFEVAGAFDLKFLEPEYIAYTGTEAIAQQALAIRAAASFDVRFFTPDSVVYHPSLTDSVVYHPSVTDMLMEEFLAEEFAKAQNYGFTPEQEELFAHEACFDMRYFMPGHITCPDSG